MCAVPGGVTLTNCNNCHILKEHSPSDGGDEFTEATEPIEDEVPLMAPFKPEGKKPPVPVELPSTTMLTTCTAQFHTHASTKYTFFILHIQANTMVTVPYESCVIRMRNQMT